MTDSPDDDPEPKRSAPADLMAALEASLAKARANKSPRVQVEPALLALLADNARPVVETTEERTTDRSPEDRKKHAEAKGAEVDVELRKTLGYGALGIMAGQMIVTDAIFGWYGSTLHWTNLAPGVMQGWMASTVVEAVGIVAIVANYLFPRPSKD